MIHKINRIQLESRLQSLIIDLETISNEERDWMKKMNRIGNRIGDSLSQWDCKDGVWREGESLTTHWRYEDLGHWQVGFKAIIYHIDYEFYSTEKRIGERDEEVLPIFWDYYYEKGKVNWGRIGITLNWNGKPHPFSDDN